MTEILPTLADLYDLTYAERTALRSLLGVHAGTPLRDCLNLLIKRKTSLNVLLWMIEIELEALPAAATTAPEEQSALPLPRTHPLCERYKPDELRLLARKLNLPIGFKSAHQLAVSIEALALDQGWNADTLNLLLHTRAMPQFKPAHPDMLE